MTKNNQDTKDAKQYKKIVEERNLILVYKQIDYFPRLLPVVEAMIWQCSDSKSVGTRRRFHDWELSFMINQYEFDYNEYVFFITFLI